MTLLEIFEIFSGILFWLFQIQFYFNYFLLTRRHENFNFQKIQLKFFLCWVLIVRKFSTLSLQLDFYAHLILDFYVERDDSTARLLLSA